MEAAMHDRPTAHMTMSKPEGDVRKDLLRILRAADITIPR